MKDRSLFSAGPAKCLSARVRPGGVIAIPHQVLLALGGDSTKISVEVKGNRLIFEKHKSPAETKLERFKARLAERLHQAALVERRKALAELAAQAQELDMGY